jgi:hypothetical protein
VTALIRAAHALVLTAATVILGQQAARTQTATQVLTTAALAVGALFAICWAGAALCAWGWSLVTEARTRRLANAYVPPQHPLWPYGQPDPATLARDAYVIDEYAYDAQGRHAAQPAHDGLTLPMPVVKAAARDWNGAGVGR